MTRYVHHLAGCTPVPLAGYLKGLGILRLVSEQKDADARGWWQDEHFCLMTSCDAAELTRFFLEEYSPTPVFNPWGARSGYYSGSSEKSARIALEKIESSSEPRLASFKAAIAEVRAVVSEGGDVKPEEDEAELTLVSSLNARLRGPGREWLSAVLTMVGEDYKAPALFGTGGNEGSGSYTSAFLAAVVSCVLDRSEDRALVLSSETSATAQAALPAHGWDGAFGQFVPDSRGSAWDLLLAMEGAILFSSTLVARLDARPGGASRFAATPFYFPTHGAGAGSLSEIDEFALNKGRRNPGRGEQWFPLWRRPTSLPELASVIAEGRCALHGRQANGASDAALAINRLGVARGIDTFCRYGYLQRNNQATHFAVPLGRVQVQERRTVRLLDDVGAWLGAVRRVARAANAVARFVQAQRVLADSVFSVLTHDDEPWRWQAVLLAAVEVESIQVSGAGIKAGPLPPLSPGWLNATNDSSAEWRLACALGSASAEFRRGRPIDSIRRHWLPLDDSGRRFSIREKRLNKDPRVVASGRDPVNDLIAVVTRRLVEASQRAERHLPIEAAWGFGATPGDLSAWLSREVDASKVLGLSRAFMAVRWDRAVVSNDHGSRAPGGEWPDEAWMAIRLACLPWPIDTHCTVPSDAAMVNRLAAGDGAAAGDLALRRLRSAGLRPVVHAACADPQTARHWGAALAFPISRSTARAMARRLDSNALKETR